MMRLRFWTMMLANSRSCRRFRQRKRREGEERAHLVLLEDLGTNPVDPLGVQAAAELADDEAPPRLEQLPVCAEQLKKARHQAGEVVVSSVSIANRADLGEEYQVGTEDAVGWVGEELEEDGEREAGRGRRGGKVSLPAAALLGRRSIAASLDGRVVANEGLEPGKSCMSDQDATTISSRAHLPRRLLMQHQQPLKRRNPRLLAIAQKLQRQLVDRQAVLELAAVRLVRVDEVRRRSEVGVFGRWRDGEGRGGGGD